MVRSVEVGGTDYSNQSFGDMLVDLEEWIALLRWAQEQYHSYVQRLEESGYWDNVIASFSLLKLRNLLGYSIKFYDMSEKELAEILEEIRREVQPHHITRIMSLYQTAVKLEDRYFAIWGDDRVERIKDYNSPDFKIIDDLHSLGREVTADMRDLSNLAQRLKDFVGKKSKVTEVEPDDSVVVPLGEVNSVLDGIKAEMESSLIEEALKDVALYDLGQARTAYGSGAFKACIVMLGAVLEGLMLGTMRRADVLDKISTEPNPPNVLKRLGLGNPQLAEKIGEELGFEDYKNIIIHLMPEIEKLKVEGIQAFRNAIHPWKTVKDAAIYADPDQTRAMNHITSLAILAHHILSWTPRNV